VSDLEHDAYDLEPTELSKDERHLRNAADALDAAGVPRVGEQLGLELNLSERIQRLVGQRDAMMSQRDKAIADAEESSRRYNAVADERRRGTSAGAPLRPTLALLLVARVVPGLQAHAARERQRDVDILAKAREIADNAEDKIAMLKAKVARLTATKKPTKKMPTKKPAKKKARRS
jgi:hypothetical protein